MTLVEQFGLFIARVDELGTTALIRRNGLETRFRLHFDNRAGGGFAFSQPDEELLRSFLLTFRQFLMDKEPVFIRRILSLAYRHISSDQLRARVAENSEDWKRILKSCGF